MASVQPSDDTPAFVDFDEFVAYQLGEVKSAVRSADLTTALVGSLAWIGSVSLLFVLSDQWLFDGGWSFLARCAWLCLLVGGLVAWIASSLIQPLIRKVSPLYAAQELETAVPSLRRNLVNLVDLQSAERPISPTVLKSLQKRAAVSLEQIQPRQAIDHTHLLRASYILLAAVVLLAAYAVFSPKPIWPSLLRMIPFTRTEAPTETIIKEVTPGSVKRLAGSVLDIQVQLAGRIPEEIQLKYTTADRQFVDETLRMLPVGQGGARFEARLLGERGEGFTQSLTYHVVAGDARSENFQVTVITPPHANIDEIEATPPAYTGLEKLVTRGGAIHAWAGSSLKIKATANQPVASATMVFLNDDGLTPTGEEIPAKLVSPTNIQLDYTPTLRQDGTYPRHYSLVVRTAAGETDPSPSIHPIALQVDQGPEIRLVLPEADVETAANSSIPFVASAKDPDFLLGPMTLIIEKQGQIISREEISAGGMPQLTAQVVLRLDRFALEEKDELRVYAIVQDNHQPTPHTARSDARLIRIRGVLPPKQQREQRQHVEEQAQQAQKEAQQNAAQQAGENPPQPGGEGAEDVPNREAGKGNERDGMPEAGRDEAQPAGNDERKPQKGKQPNPGQPAPNNQEMSNDDAQDGAPKDGNSTGDQANDSQKPGDGERSGDDPKNGTAKGEQLRGSSQPKSKPPEGGGNSDKGKNEPNSNPSGKPGSSGNQRGDRSSPNRSDPDRSQEGLSPNGEDDSAVLKKLMNQPPKNPPQTPKPDASQDEQKGSETPSRTKPGTSQEGDTDPTTNDTKTDGQQQPGSEMGSDRKSKPAADGSDNSIETPPNSVEKMPASGDQKSNADANQPGTEDQPQAGKSSSKPAMKQPSSDPTEGNEKGAANDDQNKPAQGAKGGEDQAKNIAEKNQTDKNPPGKNSPDDPKAGKSPPEMNDGRGDPAGGENSPAPQDGKPSDSEMSGKGPADQPAVGQKPVNENKPNPSSAKPSPSQPQDGTQEAPGSEKPDDKMTPADRRAGRDGAEGTLEADKDRPENSPAGRAKADAPSPADAPKKPGEAKQMEEKPGQAPPEKSGNEPSPAKGEPGADRQTQPSDSMGQPPENSPNKQGAPRPNNDPREAPSGNGEPMRGEQGKEPQADRKAQKPDSGEAGKSSANPDGADGMAEGAGNDMSSEKAKPGEDGQPGTSKSGSPEPGSPKAGSQKSGAAKSGDTPPGNSPEGAPKDGEAAGDKSSAPGQKGGDPQDPGMDPAGGKNSGEQKGAPPGGEKPGADQKSGGDPQAGGKEGGAPKSGPPGGGEGAGKTPGQGAGSGKAPPGGPPQGGGQPSGGPASGSTGGGAGGEMPPSGPSSKGPKAANGAGGVGEPGNAAGEGEAGANPVNDSPADPNHEREAAELVLDQLEEQLERGEVDSKLLEDLGWNEDQMRSFAKRMRQQINASKSQNPTAEDLLRKRQFEEMLDAAKLSRKSVESSGTNTPKRDIDQAGSRRSAVPEQYRERYEAYTRGVQKKAAAPQAPPAPGKKP